MYETFFKFFLVFASLVVFAKDPLGQDVIKKAELKEGILKDKKLSEDIQFMIEVTDEDADFGDLFILDPMNYANVTDQELSRHAENLIELEKIDFKELSKGQTSVLKGRLTCPDVIAGITSTPTDPDVNMVCANCYAFCMMELVMLQYLQTLKKDGSASKSLENKIKADLLLLKKFISPLLDACAAAFWAFKDGSLRNQLNDLQKKVQEEARQLNPMD